eukprot:4431985-Ditylum_brightwellii.AAC.1
MPESAIARVDALSCKQKQKPNITVTDCNGNPIRDNPISAAWLAGVDNISDLNIVNPVNNDNDDTNAYNPYNPYNSCTANTDNTDDNNGTLLEQAFEDNGNIHGNESVTITNQDKDHRSVTTTTNDHNTDDDIIDNTVDGEYKNDNDNNGNKEGEENSAIQQLEEVVAQTEEKLDAKK